MFHKLIRYIWLATKWVNWTTTLLDIQNEIRISQDVDGECNRTRSTFEFQVSLDTKNEGSNFCELKLICKIFRKQPSSECKDWRKFLTFRNLSVRANIYGECSREKSFTKWFHIECPNHLKMTNRYPHEHQVAGRADPNFISKEDAAQMQVKTEQGKTARILCDLVIFGLLIEISESIEPMNIVCEFERRLDDRSSLGTLLFPALTSSYNTNREAGTSNEDEVKLMKEHSLEYVRGNKFLLAAVSPVFRKMLFETDMICFIFIEIDIAVELLSAAGLYNIPDFRVRAFEWMKWISGTPQGKDEVLEFLKTAAKDVHMGFINYLL
ncbi:unnamed protein product [Allacma fusca]|uniref:BTB domain-containing protein n=1 Tax=Allacma fusca TaxID=39272 RepID=A0A8J2Q3U7_9HEXA|nr:unnamed protein product [Allacma fusca]